MRPIYQQVVDGQPLPFNDAYANLEGTTFQQEVELMVLKDQSPEQTQQNLAKAFAAYQA